MKKFKVVFPIGMADAFAEYCIANGIKVLLSWTIESGILDPAKVAAICSIEEDKIEALKASDWKKYLTV